MAKIRTNIQNPLLFGLFLYDTGFSVPIELEETYNHETLLRILERPPSEIISEAVEMDIGHVSANKMEIYREKFMTSYSSLQPVTRDVQRYYRE